MPYYNYHAIAKKLIESGFCISACIFGEYHHIKPALVLYFSCHKPIPIREYMWKDYLSLLKEKDIIIQKPNEKSIKKP